MTRPIYFTLGWVFFSLGIIGAFLPVMPTTVFMILALWAFSNSSERFHDWLYHHRVFGPPLQLWKQHRVIPIQGKMAAIIFMAGSLIYLIFFTSTSPWATAGAGLVMLLVAIYIISKPSQPPV